MNTSLASTPPNKEDMTRRIFTGLFAAPLAAQSPILPQPGDGKPLYLGRTELADQHHQAIAGALGSRLTTAGRERQVLAGNLTRGGASTALRITRELPVSFRIEEARAGGRVLSAYNDVSGTTSVVAARDEDQEAVESLTQDTPEVFLYSLGRGVAYRYIGARFRTDEGKDPNYTGPYLDISRFRP